MHLNDFAEAQDRIYSLHLTYFYLLCKQVEGTIILLCISNTEFIQIWSFRQKIMFIKIPANTVLGDNGQFRSTPKVTGLSSVPCVSLVQQTIACYTIYIYAKEGSFFHVVFAQIFKQQNWHVVKNFMRGKSILNLWQNIGMYLKFNILLTLSVLQVPAQILKILRLSSQISKKKRNLNQTFEFIESNLQKCKTSINNTMYLYICEIKCKYTCLAKLRRDCIYIQYVYMCVICVFQSCVRISSYNYVRKILYVMFCTKPFVIFCYCV
eukprot:TRINITY_DN3726_c0_g1_i4.p2 TRINITY_DN3726_c0_g1~~TRINITY_DN3726_c0_g1_i4.p2  ORF type:complete len:266 (-),score=-13.61 TRINITY_DN3726_c0_g1_i4:597-1394(-)